MGHIVRRELHANYKATLLWALALSAMTYLIMYLFPSIAHQQAKWDQLIGQLPKGILAGFGMDQLRLSDIFGYYGTQIYPLLVLFVAIYAVMLLSGLLAREESDGTIDFLIARPISRATIFWGKAAAGLLLVLVCNALLLAATWASFVQFHTQPYASGLLVWFALGLTLMTLVFGALGLLLGVHMPRRRALNSATIGIALLTYIVGIASAMGASLRGLRYVSPYQFVDATTIVAKKGVPAGDWLGLLAVTALLCAAAYRVYTTRDIGV